MLVEGVRQVGELLSSPHPTLALIVDLARADRPEVADVLARAAPSIPRWAASGAAFDRLGATKTTPPILAVADLAPRALDVVLASAPLLVLDGVSDPGNAGTLLRCARAFGVGAVAFAGAGVHPTNDKLVRASAGAVFHLAWATTDRPATDLARDLRARGAVVLATTPRGGVAPAEAARRAGRRWALWLGGEARGIEAMPEGALPVSIAMPGGAESLNVAIAGAILLHALTSYSSA